MNTKPVICIAGKNEVAVNALKFVVSQVAGDVVCIPNKSDQGADGWQPSLKHAADNLFVDTVQLADIYPEKNLVFLSLEFDQIIKPELFVSKKLLNFHFSLLPKYRGCHTSVWPILNGEVEHGVTLHLIDSGIDTGAIIAQISFPIDDYDTSQDLYFKCMKFSLQLLKENFNNLVEGRFSFKPQIEKYACYYSRNSINYSALSIPFEQGAEAVCRYIRAFCFPAYQTVQFNGQNIYKAEITKQISNLKSGELIAKNGSLWSVSTADKDVILFTEADYNEH